MVPEGGCTQPVRIRFPRASGDGPLQKKGLGAMPKFPPRERGWSPAADCAATRRAVSPARAGMVLSLAVDAVLCLCFPRASGDGPVE